VGVIIHFKTTTGAEVLAIVGVDEAEFDCWIVLTVGIKVEVRIGIGEATNAVGNGVEVGKAP
jgi:hypothetical protein